MLGSVNKLNFVRIELEEAAKKADLDAAYDYTDYHIENYLTRLYALRERLLTALQFLTGLDTCDLKDKRPLAVPRFLAVAPIPAQIVVDLLGFMQDDNKTRNEDTHNSFFLVWLYDGSDVWEQTDVLLDVRCQPDVRDDVEARLWTLLRRFVEEHCRKLEHVMEKTQAFVDDAMGIKREPPAKIGDILIL